MSGLLIASVILMLMALICGCLAAFSGRRRQLYLASVAGSSLGCLGVFLASADWIAFVAVLSFLVFDFVVAGFLFTVDVDPPLKTKTTSTLKFFLATVLAAVTLAAVVAVKVVWTMDVTSAAGTSDVFSLYSSQVWEKNYLLLPLLSSLLLVTGVGTILMIRARDKEEE